MKSYRVYQVDAFTKTLFAGNPAGVVTNADGLTDEQMQAIARELNNSETAFILTADSSDHDVRIRFFTPTTEVPSCGHATVSAHYVRALENNLDSTTVVHKIGAGVLPVEILKEDGNYRVIATQGKIEFFEPFSEEQECEVVAALGLSESDRDLRCPVQVVSTGHSKVLIGINSKKTLNALSPNLSRLAAFSKEIKCNGYFVFTLDSPYDGILSCGRMFAPAIGIVEDPVTGNANGPLGAYLVKHGLVSVVDGVFDFTGRQGEAMGRPGDIGVRVEVDEGGLPARVRISGEAVVAFKTEISL